MGFDLAEKTLALVGFGRIARRVAEITRAIRMRVRVYDPYIAADAMAAAGVTACPDLPSLLEGAHVLSLHAPLGEQTRRLIGAEQIARLAPGAILINTARGPLLDEAAVLAALESGNLAGAGIDVWEKEPVPNGHPLFLHPRVVAYAPHGRVHRRGPAPQSRGCGRARARGVARRTAGNAREHGRMAAAEAAQRSKVADRMNCRGSTIR
jgi:D-3-phosphoglycerate dehydrogenase